MQDFKEFRDSSLRESVEIFAHKGQGQNPTLSIRAFQPFTQHCIKNQHDSKTTWTQEHFGKLNLCKAQLRSDDGNWKSVILYVHLYQKHYKQVFWMSNTFLFKDEQTLTAS